MATFVRLQQVKAVLSMIQPFNFGEFFGRTPLQSVHLAQSPNFASAAQYARQRLQALPPHLTYHSSWHTWHDVLPAVDYLLNAENISGENALLLRTAAIYHDVGFVVQVKEHERFGARIAGEVLPNFGYNQTQIRRIRQMIMATKLPQSPQNVWGQILADADLDVLGRRDFWERNQMLRDEYEAVGVCITDEKWCQAQLNFLQSHQYFTSAAKKRRNEQKQANIAFLQHRLAYQTVFPEVA